MSELIYRGVAFDSEQNKAEINKHRTDLQNAHTSELIYRGTSHDGTQPEEHFDGEACPTRLIYRGVRHP